ncbi:MAG TPA: extracellular solute-binding protein [Acidimicrobiales bacterium]|nr:extracellular solute-binding protein [Acidimicrobiales bacterium]
MDATEVSSALSRRTLLKYGLGTLGASAVGATLLSGCGSGSDSTSTASTSSSPPTTATMGGRELLGAAKKEGTLTTAAVGEPFSYYAPVVEGFEDFAGFQVDLKHPTYPATAQVVDLAEAAKTKMKPPYDVIEVTQSTANQAIEQDLLDPYVSSLWVDVPSLFKDADGYWSAAYFGLTSFIVNTDATDGFLPESWDELASSKKTPKGSFAMLGDPRTGQPLEGGLGLLTVMSAAIANGGSVDDVEPGLELLGQLVDKGVFELKDSSSLLALPDDAGTELTPINVLYSFDLPLAQHSGTTNGSTVEGKAPADGLVAGFYPQAIAAGSQHSSAARLWIEFLQSDRGAAIFLANGAIPTRASAIRLSGSKELRDALPPESELDAPVPSVSQVVAAQKTIDEKWTDYIPVEK